MVVVVEERKSSGCAFSLAVVCSDLFRRRENRSSSYSSTSSLTPTKYRRRRHHHVKSLTTIGVSPTQVTPPHRHQHPSPGKSIHDQNNPQLRPSKSSQLQERMTLVRASSGNVMLYGNLGNLRSCRQSITTTSPGASTLSIMDYLPQTAKESETTEENGGRNATGERYWQPEPVVPIPVPVPGLLDPEELKEMGNEEYKKGRYAEAVRFYDQATALDPKKATYRSSKAAALTALGRLLEAVAECRESVRIEPSLKRAHHRLGILYLRLGKPEKAAQHLKLSGTEATPEDADRAQTLRRHMERSGEARRLKQWNAVVEETQASISSGADSSPQVFAMQAEALLRLQRHADADATLIDAPKFGTDESTKFFGTIINAFVVSVHAQITMAGGRFDEAVAMAQMASQIDPSSMEAVAVFRRARTIAAARSKGNDLFKICKYTEASVAYTDGLNRDPHNSVLLCNRAACRIKMNQLDKAIEDCGLTLKLRPSYTKARLRRADCYSKMERWEESKEDYEVLLGREMAGDEDVQRALSAVKLKLKQQREA